MKANAIATNTASVSPERNDRWRAVLNRDAAFDGNFVYAVLTTLVYCRPSCPSRRPNPENVRFFETYGCAERAGFRPCKRCTPNQSSRADKHRVMVAEACRVIEAADEMPTLDALARRFGLSPFHFHRLFKAVTGVTPKSYADAYRARRVRAALAVPDTSVTRAIYDGGFNSSSRFYAAADDMIGMTPRAYRAGGLDTVIRFAVGDCSLGSILVAASGRGVCAILLGDDPERLLRDLQDRFPKAELVGGDEQFDRLVAAVVDFVEAPSGGLDLPLDIVGTAFQRRVWETLRAIPAGQTASYGEIARLIGQPRSVRAVAQACAANAHAVAIPCHRVVRQDGDLSGYRWGIERKRRLLDREAGSKLEAL